MKILAIALALGDLFEMEGTGNIIQPLDGGAYRFEAVTSGLRPTDNNTLVVCTAGYTKQHPTRPQPERRESLAGQLKRYVDSYEFRWRSKLVVEPLCWSTRNEVRVGIKLASRIGFANKDEEVEVRIASNRTHLFRIWMYAKLYTPKKWKFNLVVANHHFSLQSHILEIPKLIRDVIYIMRVMRRLKHVKAIALTPR